MRGVVDTTLQNLPAPEPPAISPPTDVLPTAPTPPRTVAPPPPASGDETAPEGAGAPAAPAEEDAGQPAAGPTGTHLSNGVSDARGKNASADPHRVEPGERGTSAPLRAARDFTIPEAEPATTVAALERAAPIASDGGSRAQPVSLSDWIGSGPPLPGVVVYFVVFASGLAIFVSMRRELGLHPRRHRRF